MGNRSRFERVLPEIIEFFEYHSLSVFSTNDLRTIFKEQAKEWFLPAYMSFELFLNNLLEHTPLESVNFINRENGSRKIYSFGKVRPELIAQALFPDAYLSHLSAIDFFIPSQSNLDTIFVTKEQSRKYIDTDIAIANLQQENIDRAFSKSFKSSNDRFIFQDSVINVLKGKFSNNLGVAHYGFGGLITNPERTLIDIAVRPGYSGGVKKVLEFYKNMKKGSYGVDTRLINEYLKRLNFIYPYHQAIGFYLDRSGVYKENELSIFRDKVRLHDFYLDYEIGNAAFSKEWKIYYPKHLDNFY